MSTCNLSILATLPGQLHDCKKENFENSFSKENDNITTIIIFIKLNKGHLHRIKTDKTITHTKQSAKKKEKKEFIQITMVHFNMSKLLCVNQT